MEAENALPDDSGLPAGSCLRVTAATDGFRRAGFRFGPEPVIIPADQLDPDKMIALVGEPRLVVEASRDGENFAVLRAVDLPDFEAAVAEAILTTL